MPLISVCIPTYEMNGKGSMYLRHSFDMLHTQVFKDFEVIISDHSGDDNIKNLCEEFSKKLKIVYKRNSDSIGNSSANINNAMRLVTGRIIKVLFQDDFLFNADALFVIAQHFNIDTDKWLMTACEHSYDGKTCVRPFYPKYNDEIHLGENTISSPSVLCVLNEQPLMFDENLLCLMDCDYYKRCYIKFGLPKVVNQITVVNRIGEHQVSNTLATNEVKNRELLYVNSKQYK